MYESFVNYIMPVLGTALGSILSALLAYIVIFINKKKKELIENSQSNLETKYLDLICETITDCVIATNQTYVESLKKEGAFTKESQEIAFNRTVEAIMDILSADCIEYLKSITNDIDEWLRIKIEAEVNQYK